MEIKFEIYAINEFNGVFRALIWARNTWDLSLVVPHKVCQGMGFGSKLFHSQSYFNICNMYLELNSRRIDSFDGGTTLRFIVIWLESGWKSRDCQQSHQRIIEVWSEKWIPPCSLGKVKCNGIKKAKKRGRSEEKWLLKYDGVGGRGANSFRQHVTPCTPSFEIELLTVSSWRLPQVAGPVSVLFRWLDGSQMAKVERKNT